MEPEKQPPLSLRWESAPHWPALRAEFGVDETGAAVILALTTAQRWVSYSRHKGHYDVPRRYSNRLYRYRPIVKAADFLDAQGLIEHDRRQPGQRGWQSAMLARPNLIARTHEIITAGPRLEIARPRETVILRGPDGELLDYKETYATKAMRRKLDLINEGISSAEISGLAAAPLVRIFNLNFRRGGRFYCLGGGWQSMRKQDRQKITIGGEPVCEVDYRCLHPAILYSQAGAPLPRDCYAIDGWPRGLVKIGLLICINAKNRASARLAIAHHEAMEEVAPVGSQEAIAAADRLIDDIKRVHKPIAWAFHTDKGAELMLLDATIAETVMLLLRQQGIVALPIHDSFLVQESKAAILEECMMVAAHQAGIFALETAHF